MAKIEPKNGKYKLDDSRDTELEGIDDKKYDVFTEHTKWDEAKSKYGHIHWFASYTIKDKHGNAVRELPEYTIKLDKPDSENFQLYYYLDEEAHPFSHEGAEDKASKKRVKARLSIGDPPTGHYP